ncbi:MAG TPA: alpha/beta fold hydrolase [Mycobacteriales bacterium]
MPNETAVESKTGRKYFLDFPREPGAGLTFLLNLHGGGSVGMWQRRYFPAHVHVDDYRLVVATPSAATKEPFRHWDREADDEHLRAVVGQVCDRFGPDNIRACWLVGHSQGGMTANRLLHDPFFADRVDGWLSLSGGRIGSAPLVEGFGPPRTPEQQEAMARMRGRFPAPTMPEADFSFIYATGEYEISELPETSPWAEKYGAGPRVRRPDVVDTEGGKVHDTRWGDRSTPSWGREPGPGTAEIYVYPGGRDGRLIADVVRRGKGHTEGLEPHITEELITMMIGAPGGKLAALHADRTVP